MEPLSDPSFFECDGERIAYRKLYGAGPGILWLGGFRSGMEGNKARALADWAARTGRGYLRFDYFGHGRSSGDFAAGTISRWRDDALAVLDNLAEGPQILVGSSMGGWIALLAARLRPDRVAALLLIAPAADFTEDLMWGRMATPDRETLLREGVWLRGSADPEERYPITRALIEDGRANLVLRQPFPLYCPARILQGMADSDVPWEHTMKLVGVLTGDVTVTLVKGGDHRLSKPADLRLLERSLDGLTKDIEG